MLENLKRIREPLAWAALGIVVLAILTSAAQVLLYVDLSDVVNHLYWAYSAQAGWSLFLLVLALAVWGCAVTPAIPRARLLATLSAWVGTLAVGLPLVVVAISMAGATPRFMPDLLPSALAVLPDTLLGVLAVVVLWALARREPEEWDEDEEDEVAAIAPAPEADAAPAPERPTVWNRTEATGTAWRTADEAASGAPGTASLASPDEADDWGPPPRS